MAPRAQRRADSKMARDDPTLPRVNVVAKEENLSELEHNSLLDKQDRHLKCDFKVDLSRLI